jgi:hypothetical protein
LTAERERGGPYRGVADLASRSGAGRDGLERLAWAGALDDLPVADPAEEGHRRERYWQQGIAATSRTRDADDGEPAAAAVTPPAQITSSPTSGGASDRRT